MSSVAFAVWLASDFTSEATTAKPLPASPARAASMVAFSASRLVWPAMSLMSLTTSPILRVAVSDRALDGIVGLARLLDGARGDARGMRDLAADIADRGAELFRGGGDALHVDEASSGSAGAVRTCELVRSEIIDMLSEVCAHLLGGRAQRIERLAHLAFERDDMLLDRLLALSALRVLALRCSSSMRAFSTALCLKVPSASASAPISSLRPASGRRR